MNWIGIDNGTTGALAIINKGAVEYLQMPVKKEQSYTKTKQKISRINAPVFREILYKYLGDPDGIRCMIERPMLNPDRFKASISALRALEATIIVLEELNIPYQYVDSKEWQRRMLPGKIWKTVIDKSGKPRLKADPAELKSASHDIAIRLFPQLKNKLIKTSKKGKEIKKDGDALLIAEYFRRYYAI